MLDMDHNSTAQAMIALMFRWKGTGVIWRSKTSTAILETAKLAKKSIIAAYADFLGSDSGRQHIEPKLTCWYTLLSAGPENPSFRPRPCIACEENATD